MGFTINQRALAVLLGLGFVCVYLLTPAGLETRPIPSIHPLGFAGLGGILTTVALNAAALILMNRRPRVSATMVAAGCFLVVAGISVDLAGFFSSFASPLRISGVEVAFVLLELGALVLAVRMYRDDPPRPMSSA
jgi:hypothetical protein